MIRVAIIGNSHIGAYAEASQAIRAAFPTVELSFFAFPRHDLRSADLGDDGWLRARGDHDSALPSEIDLAAQDRVIVAGQPFAMIGLDALLAEFDILGWPGTGKARRLSPALFAEYTRQAVTGAAGRLMKWFGDDGRGRFTYLAQPLVTDRARPGSSKMATLAFHPAAPRIFEQWHSALAATASDMPCPIVPQPPELRASDVFTPHRFARAATLPPDRAPAPADHIHMSAEYALAHFRAIAKTWPELHNSPERPPGPLPIKESE
ncbi:hypothetical protein [Aquicoccus sp.]|uniref:hypothetical protein n=1 Tax=Aquicoccus sp. TaxID=2055851 RepID=UPI0035694EC4